MKNPAPRRTGSVALGAASVFLAAVVVLGACESAQPPAARDPIPQVTIHAGETDTVMACFNDPNGDVLTYSATSSDAGVATVSVSGTNVTVAAVSPGSASITLTARDPGGMEGQQNFDVVVPNRAPQPAGTISPATVSVGQSEATDLSSYFTEPDGEALVYGAASSNEELAGVAVSGSVVTVTAIAKGAVTVTVTAKDPGGLSAEQSFRVTVPNRAPVAVGELEDLEVEVDSTAELDVADSFEDPDGDALTYAAISSSPTMATVSVSGSVVTVTGVAKGTVTVTATDTEGLSAGQSFRVTVANPDRVALVALYDALGGAGWVTNSNWKTDAPLGEWHGVTTNADERVVMLELRENGLVGQLPAALGRLHLLERLDLALNGAGITGSIPPELGDLAALEELWLESNSLTGAIPVELGDLSNLRDLLLAENLLSGPIPHELGDLEGLVELSLAGNELTGSIPAPLGGMGELVVLALQQNQLVGALPAALGNLGALEFLYLHGNELTGSIPASLGDLDGLVELSLRDNELEGEIPAALGSLSSLEQLALQRNQLRGNAGLTGALPLELAGLGALLTLDLRETGLCAPRDSAFQEWLDGVETRLGVWDCPSPDKGPLEELYEATGGGSWTDNTGWLEARRLGDWYGVTTRSGSGHVARLELGENNLAGEIPSTLGDLADVEVIYLHGNELTGSIPASLGDLDGLVELSLRDNELEGQIPAALGSLSSLEQLALQHNQLEDSLPSSLGRLTELVSLYLHENELTGSIPDSLGNLAALEELSLRDNELTGEIPSSLGDLDSLRLLALQRNDLENALPSSLGNLTELEQLLLNGNAELSGPLPSSLTNLTDLNTLDLRDTDLCAPTDEDFQEWLEGIETRRGVYNCTD
ncbi:MAG: Ig-like domain-containing protein [Gemmatimonadetes bacterium]|nr:Ig-like domain-containing protein [Gemmatimonadota bacterium]